MRQSSELLLTFLLNATWQILLVTAAASLASWLLRQSPARYRHIVWTTALLLALTVPLISVSKSVVDAVSVDNDYQASNFAAAPLDVSLPANLEIPIEESSSSSFHLNTVLASVLIIGYLALLGFRVFRLAEAWFFARQVRKRSSEIVGNERVNSVIRHCEKALGQWNRPVTVFSSGSLHVPVTIGLFRPVIILPEELLQEDNAELLTSAIGHEYIHVARRDYFFNLLYELLYLPLSFHPAASFIRRYIKQTRELCCDELVAERIIKPEAYARSLLKLAGCAPTLRRLSVSTTVGIADADILEARIMSLLKKRKTDIRWKRVALVVVSLLLVVPCIAAAAFAMRFDTQSPDEVLMQEPLTEEKQQREVERENLKHEIAVVRARLEQLAAEPVAQEKQQQRDMEKLKLRARIDYLRGRLTASVQEPVSPELQKEKEKEKEKLKRKIEFQQNRMATEEGEAYAVYQELEGRERRREKEIIAKMITESALVKHARIQMDQAIQIATSLHPGKVLSSTLRGDGWEEPGRLGQDGRVFYHIVLLSGDESNLEITHVIVNAVDGTIVKAEKELPRKMMRSKQPD